LLVTLTLPNEVVFFYLCKLAIQQTLSPLHNWFYIDFLGAKVELENLCGVSASYINRLERGERRSPSISVILRLAGVLDIPSSVLLAAINIKEPQASEKITLSELIIKHEFLLNGEELSREAKEKLLKIVEHIAQCQWNSDTKVRDIFVLAELVDQFKLAV
jgi:transcriptional regulator with XRE-family HTH domain